MRKFLILFALVLVVSLTTFGQTAYNTYGNARFGYTISYPSNLKPQGEADNGDGQVFKGDEAQLTVYGSNMLLSETLLKEYNAVVKERGSGNLTYKIYRKNYFVISGKADGVIFYRKTMAKADGSYATFIFEYDEAKRGVYDKAVTKISGSFK